MDLSDLKNKYNSAAERVIAAADAIDAAGGDDDYDALRRELDDAVESAERAKAALDLAEVRQRAVERFRPISVDTSPVSSVRVTSEEPIYRPDVRRSFFADLARARVMGDAEAAERIGRHDAQMRDISTGAGADGVLPPQYLADLYTDLPRPGRPVAAILNAGRPLPDTGMTLTLPRLASGVAVASQASENTAVQETDADTDQVSVPVRTIAGMQDVSRQALERTDPAFDRIIFEDLVAAYDAELDRQVIAGTGSGGTHTGLLGVSGTVGVTYTDTTPTALELIPKAHDALQQMWSEIYRSATHCVMHPRRAAWLASATSSESPVFPQPGIVDGQRGEQGYGFITSFAGLPVIVDANVPTNLGAGTNEDAIIFVNAPSLPLFESPVSMMVENSPGAHTLTVRFVAYGYSAFAGARRPKAIAKITGTGLVPPTF